MKNRFYGKYYKFVSNDGFVFAIIDSYSNEGRKLQLITKEKSYQIHDLDSVSVYPHSISIDIKQGDLVMNGYIKNIREHHLKRKSMGIFSILPLECKHDIYSMYHSLHGEVWINNKTHVMHYGYIEGDKGCNFPKKYVWYNSINTDYGITLAIASIPIGFIKFTGLLCIVATEDKDYYLSTYNFAKIKALSRNRIEIKKGKYKLEIDLENSEGNQLKAPINGNMNRYIKENIAVPSKIKFTKEGRVLLDRKDKSSSLEYMWD